VNFVKNFVFVLFIILSNSVQAKKLILKDANQNPLSLATVVMIDLNSRESLVRFSDNKGELIIPDAIQVPFVLQVAHLSIETLCDTIYINSAVYEYDLPLKNIQLNEVVITTEYAPRQQSKSMHTVQVISAQQINDQGYASINEVLSRKAGLELNNDAVLGSSIKINGMSGNNIKVLLDGLPVNGRLNGNIDLSQIAMSGVERIEVVEGPMSVNYGTDASGGIINIISKQSVQDNLIAQLKTHYESIGQYNADFWLGKRFKRSNFIVSAGRNYFDGWSNDESERYLDWKPKEQWFGSAKYIWFYHQSRFMFSTHIMDEKLTNKGLAVYTPYYIYAFDEYYKTRRNMYQFSGEHIIGNNHRAKFQIGLSEYRRIKNTYRKDLVTLNETLTENKDDQDSTRITSWNIYSTIHKAEEGSSMNFQTGFDINTESARGERFTRRSVSSDNYALFGSFESSPVQGFSFKPALRFNYNPVYGMATIPSVNVRYELGAEKAIMRLAYNRGFRAPSVKELYLYFVDVNHNIRGNESLKPEYAHSLSLNIEKRKSLFQKAMLKSELNFYFNKIDNLITLAQVNSSSNLFTYVNIGEYKSAGTRATLSIELKKWSVSHQSAYSGISNVYNDQVGRQINYGYESSNQLMYRLPEKLKSSVNLRYTYKGAMPIYISDDAYNISLLKSEAYHLLDVSMSKSFLKDQMQLNAGIKNILNVRQINSYGSATVHGSEGSSALISTGINYFCSLSYTFKKK